MQKESRRMHMLCLKVSDFGLVLWLLLGKPTWAAHKGIRAQYSCSSRTVPFKQETVRVSSQENKKSFWERTLGKQETQGEDPWKKGSIEVVDTSMETKEGFRNAAGFRKARAPPDFTLAREFKATAMSGYFFKTHKEETKILCGYCSIQEEKRQLCLRLSVCSFPQPSPARLQCSWCLSGRTLGETQQWVEIKSGVP